MGNRITPIIIANLITEDPDEFGDLSVLYHGTSVDNLQSIMHHGLDPALSGYAEDEEANDYHELSPGQWGKLGPPYHFVFLTPYIGIAKSFAVQGDKAAILEIRLPPELQQKLVLDRGEYIRCPFLIDPKYISIVST